MARELKRVALLSVAALVACLLGMMLVGVAIGFYGAHSPAFDVDRAMFWTVAVFALAMMVWALAVSVGWMRSIDEAAREAHKSAWFWGGCGGMCLGGVLMVLATLPQAAAFELPALIHGRTDPVVYAASGAFALMLLMVLGYSLAWALWWLKRR